MVGGDRQIVRPIIWQVLSDKYACPFPNIFHWLAYLRIYGKGTVKDWTCSITEAYCIHLKKKNGLFFWVIYFLVCFIGVILFSDFPYLFIFSEFREHLKQGTHSFLNLMETNMIGLFSLVKFYFDLGLTGR